MFESIKAIIGDIASGAIKDQRIALSQDQLAALELKLVSLKEELTASKVRESQSQARESKLAADNEHLRQQFADKKPADTCPYCRSPSGELVEIKPSPNPDFAFAGVKHGYYKCADCDKEYDKELA